MHFDSYRFAAHHICDLAFGQQPLKTGREGLVDLVAGEPHGGK
jgi:hypothetical protein